MVDLLLVPLLKSCYCRFTPSHCYSDLAKGRSFPCPSHLPIGMVRLIQSYLAAIRYGLLQYSLACAWVWSLASSMPRLHEVASVRMPVLSAYLAASIARLHSAVWVVFPARPRASPESKSF